MNDLWFLLAIVVFAIVLGATPIVLFGIMLGRGLGSSHEENARGGTRH